MAWLTRKQTDDGSWRSHEKPRSLQQAPTSKPTTDLRAAATATALLVFLSDGHTPHRGRYVETVRRGILWLCRNQRPNGSFVSIGKHPRAALHQAWCTLALVEATAMTSNKRLEPFTSKALHRLLRMRKNGAWPMRPAGVDESAIASAWAETAVWIARCAGFLPMPTAQSKPAAKNTDLADSVGYDAMQSLVGAFYDKETKAQVLERLQKTFRESETFGDPTVDALRARALYLQAGRSGLVQSGTLVRWIRNSQQVRGPNSPHFGSWPPNLAKRVDSSRAIATALSTLVLQANQNLSKLRRR